MSIRNDLLKRIALLGVAAVCFCYIIGRAWTDRQNYSPSATRYIVQTNTDLVSFAICNRQGHVEHEFHTRASRYHRVAYKWRSDELLVFESGDIGYSQYRRTPKGDWIEDNMYFRRSPSRRQQAELRRNLRLDSDTLTVAILGIEEHPDGNGISILNTKPYETTVRLGDVNAVYVDSRGRQSQYLLSDPLVWIDENTIAIVDRNGKELWRTKTE